MLDRRSFAFGIGLAALAIGVAPFDSAGAKPAEAAAPKVPLIEPATLQAYLEGGVRVALLDVRTPEEFRQGHINGAVLMPLDTLSNTYASLPKNGKLVVYCRTGHRSAQAVKFLIDHGYRNAISLNGGYTAWIAAKH
jgi:phage shock protein E